MSRKNKRFKGRIEPSDVELNIMPLIDIFSLLNTFLLFTATFVSIGLLKVQVPFLSNATPDKPPVRSLDITVDVDSNNVTLKTKYSSPPYDNRANSYSMTVSGIVSFHQAMLALKKANPKQDIVTLYSSDDVSYEKLVEILDAVKIDSTLDTDEMQNNNTLFPKVVIGSVLL